MTDVPEPAPRALRVVAAVIVKDGRVLACRRKPDRSAGGLWEFPGGKIEPGESAEQALVREIREELGVGVTVGALLHCATTVADGTPIELASFATALTGDVPIDSTDHDALAWFKASQLDALRWAKPDVPVVELLIDGILDTAVDDAT